MRRPASAAGLLEQPSTDWSLTADGPGCELFSWLTLDTTSPLGTVKTWGGGAQPPSTVLLSAAPPSPAPTDPASVGGALRPPPRPHGARETTGSEGSAMSAETSPPPPPAQKAAPDLSPLGLAKSLIAGGVAGGLRVIVAERCRHLAWGPRPICADASPCVNGHAPTRPPPPPSPPSVQVPNRRGPPGASQNSNAGPRIESARLHRSRAGRVAHVPG